MSFTCPELPTRRRRIAWKMALSAALMSLAGWAHAFTLEDVVARARSLSESPYVAPVSNLPPVFSQMQFADYLQIKPLKEGFEWANTAAPFRLAFYHQGMQFASPVRINEIVGDQVQEIRYDPARFDFGSLKFDPQATRSLGYAGFRVLYPVNRPDKYDEVMSLLGASYFRVIGKGQVYGLSARGLAIDSGQPGPEEFPRFREFWVQRSQPGDKALRIYALLDSERATGAYEFTLTPGEDMLLDVKARVFLRGRMRMLGVAPLTSMFLYGPSQPPTSHNFRPAIHDTNGLSIHAGNGEWIWRPLNNPPHVAVSTFSVDDPKGFGLLQRGRDFSRYEDLKDRYDLRPSAWIEPSGRWGKGKVTLVEIPTADETNDNIVAFWTPDNLPPAGQPLQVDYRMHWTLDDSTRMGSDTGWVNQTLRSPGEKYQANLIRQADGTLALIVDFVGPALANLPQDTTVTPTYSTNEAAEIQSAELEPNPVTRGYRLTLRVRVKQPEKAGELRAALQGPNGKLLTETWSYQIPPK